MVDVVVKIEPQNRIERKRKREGEQETENILQHKHIDRMSKHAYDIMVFGMHVNDQQCYL